MPKPLVRATLHLGLLTFSGLALLQPGQLAPVLAQPQPRVSQAQSPAETYYRRGVEAMQAWDWHGAIANFNLCIRYNPRADLAMAFRGEARSMLGDHQRGLEDVNQALSIAPRNAYAYAARASIHLRRVNYSGALNDANQAVSLSPNMASFYIGRGNIRGQSGDLQGAMVDLNRALRLEPRNAFAYASRANFRTIQGNYQEALADINQALQISQTTPNDGFSLGLRGIIRYFLGDYQSALADANRAIRLNPKSSGYYTRGVAQFGLQNYAAARADLNEALSVYANDGFSYYWLGKIRLQQGDYRGAIADYERAVRMNPVIRIGRGFDDYSQVARRQLNNPNPVAVQAPAPRPQVQPTPAPAVPPPTPALSSPPLPPTPVAATAPVRTLGAEQVAELAKTVTVFIQSGSRPQDVFGSGVIVSRSGNTYTVISAKHVVALNDNYSLTTADGQQHQIRRIEPLPNSDLAVLRFESNRTYPVVMVGGQARSLETLYISGFPKPTASVPTPGYYVVDAKVNTVLDPNQASEGYALRYGQRGQFREGMSGGPVLNGRGELIAIHGRADELGGLGIPVTLLAKQAQAAGIALNLQTANSL
jgi:tetratricopeptide (TPR) repeat protein